MIFIYIILAAVVLAAPHMGKWLDEANGRTP